jgi:hypothetical protein
MRPLDILVEEVSRSDWPKDYSNCVLEFWNVLYKCRDRWSVEDGFRQI